MNIYYYKGLLKNNGKKISGRIEAISPLFASDQLGKMGITQKRLLKFLRLLKQS